VVETFYVKDMFRLESITREAKQRALEKRLREASRNGAARATATGPSRKAVPPVNLPPNHRPLMHGISFFNSLLFGRRSWFLSLSGKPLGLRGDPALFRL